MKERADQTRFLRMTRRDLLKAGLICAISGLPCRALAGWAPSSGRNEKTITLNDAPEKLWEWSREVRFQKASGGNVQCLTCPNMCLLPPNARSRCQSHVHKDGKLYTLVYGNPCAVHVDPIEKKPFYHFLPGTWSFSIGTTGCSFHCLNCQNWQISQVKPEDVNCYTLYPEAAVEKAIEAKCRTIAFTYNEPTTALEYALDTFRVSRKQSVKGVWVSNGFINREPLLELCKNLSAARIDVKGFSEEMYQKLNAGRLAPVLETLKILKAEGVWLEMIVLIVPTYTDRMEMVKQMCGWFLKNLGPDHPVHFLRFQPQYKLTHLPPTSISFLEDARKTALSEGLHYVYVGNIPNADSNHTYCPGCRKKIINRVGFSVTENRVKNGKCGYCGRRIAGVWA